MHFPELSNLVEAATWSMPAALNRYLATLTSP